MNINISFLGYHEVNNDVVITFLFFENLDERRIQMDQNFFGNFFSIIKWKSNTKSTFVAANSLKHEIVTV